MPRGHVVEVAAVAAPLLRCASEPHGSEFRSAFSIANSAPRLRALPRMPSAAAATDDRSRVAGGATARDARGGRSRPSKRTPPLDARGSCEARSHRRIARRNGRTPATTNTRSTGTPRASTSRGHRRRRGGRLTAPSLLGVTSRPRWLSSGRGTREGARGLSLWVARRRLPGGSGQIQMRPARARSPPPAA